MIKIVVFLTSGGIQLRSENSIVSDSHSMGQQWVLKIAKYCIVD